MHWLLSLELFLLALFSLLRNCEPLKCFQCHENDKDACEKYQEVEDCPTHYKEPVCLTMTYSEVINKKETVMTIRKKCSSEEFGCSFHCINLWKDCKAICCKGDHCNVGLIENEPKAGIGKRSNTDLSASSSSTMHFAKLFLHITAIIMSFLLCNIN